MSPVPLHCDHYLQGRCRSCTLLETPYEQQLKNKETELYDLLDPLHPQERFPAVSGPLTAFRNKAKMAVIGSDRGILLGLKNESGEAVDLCDCPLYPESMQELLRGIRRWIGEAGLSPYRVDKKRGEAKFVLLTRSSRDEYLLRLVMRSREQLPQIRIALPGLLEAFPRIKVVSVNFQPLHMARLEGEEEIVLTEAQAVEESFNGIPLFIRPGSFFQTNPEVASALYRQAGEWAGSPESVWDLFCGVGGFGFHCAHAAGKLTGIEIVPEAIECARESACRLGWEDVRFQALDSGSFASDETPELLVVNPPRRGIGKELAQRLNAAAIPVIIYSSCNAHSLAHDLALMENYRVEKVRLFDMFPHTEHYEVLVKLTRNR